MKASTFRRGLKLPGRKHATEGKPVESVPPPKEVVIPVNQHFGAPNKVLVAAGDRVIRGQKIADGAAPGPMTVPVHASITGVVKKIENRLQSNNTDGLCIIIEAEAAADSGASAVNAVENGLFMRPSGPREQGSGLYNAVENGLFMPPLDPFTCTKEEALARIREAGITGMGGAAFPAHVKLAPPPGKTVDLLIADGAECEPYLTTDEAVMTEKPAMLITGLTISMKITGIKRAIIGMEDNKAALVPLLEEEIRRSSRVQSEGLAIRVGLCRTLYPQGGEKMLIKALANREVPSGGLPMDAGCIVQNVGTLVAIAEAFVLGKPLIDRDLTVSGGACKTPKNIRVPVGTVPANLPPECIAVDKDRLRKIIFGGPMMGTAVASLSIPVQKNTSGIILMTRTETAVDTEEPCIRCGRCIRNCPCRLSPVIMNNALEAADLDEAVGAGLVDCIECGSCSYVCPARIKLVQRFRVGKQRLRAARAMSQMQARAEQERGKAAPAAETVTGSANPEKR